jgi:hypothetical protein
MTAELKTTATASLADRTGIWLSSLCMVHCLATPALLSFSSVLAHLLPGEESIHRSLATLVAAMGAIALIRGFRVHGRRRTLACMAAGLGFIFLGAWFGDRLPSHVCEMLVTMTGSLLMIAAHRMNHTFCRDCRTCAH